MKKLINILPILVLIGAFIDSNYNLLQDLGMSESTGNWVKFMGLVFTSLLPSVLEIFKEKKSLSKQDGAVTPNKGF